jgi:hypothetical protein
MGAALFAEYEDVPGRDRLSELCRRNLAERNELLDIFLAACIWTRIYYAWRPNLPDEADNICIIQQSAVPRFSRHPFFNIRLRMPFFR